jgi:hypothetical protein
LAATLTMEGRIVELRSMGATFEAIASEVGLRDRGAAQRAWERSMRRGPKRIVELERERMLGELDNQLVRLHRERQKPHYVVTMGGPRAGTLAKDEEGNKILDVSATLAIEASIMRNMERRAKLLGTDAAPRVRIEVVEIDQVLEAVQKLELRQAELAAQRRAGGLPELPPGERITPL